MSERVNAVHFSLFIRLRLHKHAWHFDGNQLWKPQSKYTNVQLSFSAFMSLSLSVLYSHRVQPIQARTHIFACNCVLFPSLFVASMLFTSCLILAAELNEIHTHTSAMLYVKRKRVIRPRSHRHIRKRKKSFWLYIQTSESSSRCSSISSIKVIFTSALNDTCTHR